MDGSESNFTEFQPTLPSRGVTFFRETSIADPQISTHTPLAGSDSMSIPNKCGVFISTHTPLAGSDGDLRDLERSIQIISTHTPLAGSDLENLR